MEALIERLEQAVIRLEIVSSKMQTCHCMTNGNANGLDELVDNALRTQRAFLKIASTHKQPPQ
ncbi:hypothetical protein CRUP_013859, partial [Coryphaenoides rupestris]